MPFNRTSTRVALGLFVLLLAAPSYGQGPLGLQLFAPADVSTMGGDIQPNEGYFGQADFLWWSISAPKVVPVGFPGLTREAFVGPIVVPIPNPGSAGADPNLVPAEITQEVTQANSLNTSLFGTEFLAGVRYEFGRVEDGNGWFVSTFQPLRLTEAFFVPSATFVVQDSPFGPAAMNHLQGFLSAVGPSGNLPVTLYNITMDHEVDTWSVELMYLHRFRTCHNGGTFEFFAGPRYMEFNDRFGVNVGASPIALVTPDLLVGSSWASTAENHIIGGELGGRWFKKQGRWMLSTEGRFLAGMNRQNIHQVVNFAPLFGSTIGTSLQPLVMGTSTSTFDAAPTVFTPGIELRLEARYQLTRAISFHAGWTGMWLDGIARGDATIDYSLAANGQVFGIDLTRNKENLFINGLTLGIDINR